MEYSVCKMRFRGSIVILGLYLTTSVSALWTCTSNGECSSLFGSVCREGSCECPQGQQPTLGGTLCADIAPYHTSTCLEDFQCSRLLTAYACRKADETDTSGACRCQPNHHYFLGRCWPSVPFGSPCTRDEECLGVLRDPYSLVCNGTCSCAPGYYERQRGECRRIGSAVGDGCVLDEDCRFDGGACNTTVADQFVCYDSNAPAETKSKRFTNSSSASHVPSSMVRQNGVSCSDTEPCAAPFECTSLGCLCPVGYYASEDGGSCFAELGSPALAPEECVGLFAIIQNGVCTCPANFYFDENMRDCIKAETKSKRFTNSSSASHVPSSMVRQNGVSCSDTEPCAAPFECTSLGCLCPVGYYASEDGGSCFAELGSPALAPEECVGLFAIIQNGVCTCPANFYFDENMRDCIKASRSITDSCVSDSNCHTFGAASKCGLPQEPWGLRSCECIPEEAVWDAQRQMCRLFAGIGETCEMDSDCLAGELEIQCVQDNQGQGYCACPDGLVESDGLCLTTGLELGDACQVTAECTETPNTVCFEGRCACDGSGYQEVNGQCSPIIGGACALDSDCVIQNTVCRNESNTLTCQCNDNFLEFQEACWEVVFGINASCNVDAQCQASLGPTSSCEDNHCACSSGYHYRDGACWPVTGLFEPCSRSSQCFLSELTERVVCRNSLCQCDFDYPYSEELNSCLPSSAPAVFGGWILISTTLIYTVYFSY